MFAKIFLLLLVAAWAAILVVLPLNGQMTTIGALVAAGSAILGGIFCLRMIQVLSVSDKLGEAGERFLNSLLGQDVLGLLRSNKAQGDLEALRLNVISLAGPDFKGGDVKSALREIRRALDRAGQEGSKVEVKASAAYLDSPAGRELLVVLEGIAQEALQAGDTELAAKARNVRKDKNPLSLATLARTLVAHLKAKLQLEKQRSAQLQQAAKQPAPAPIVPDQGPDEQQIQRKIVAQLLVPLGVLSQGHPELMPAKLLEPVRSEDGNPVRALLAALQGLVEIALDEASRLESDAVEIAALRQEVRAIRTGFCALVQEHPELFSQEMLGAADEENGTPGGDLLAAVQSLVERALAQSAQLEAAAQEWAALQLLNEALQEESAKLADEAKEAAALRQELEAARSLIAVLIEDRAAFGRVEDRLRQEFEARYGTQLEELRSQLEEAREAFDSPDWVVDAIRLEAASGDGRGYFLCYQIYPCDWNASRRVAAALRNRRHPPDSPSFLPELEDLWDAKNDDA